MEIKIIQLTNDKEVTLTAYIQHPSYEMEGKKRKPAILIIPGGGYQYCSGREGEPIALAYMKAGFNAFVLHYSVKEKSVFPRPLLDAELAMKMIIEHSDEWHIDKEKIAAIGFSAGGHLVSHLGASKQYKPKAVLIGYGAVVESKELGWDYPTVSVDETYPETFLFHSYKDQVVPVEASYYLGYELLKNKVPVEMHIFRDGIHGLSLADETVSWGDSYVSDSHFAKWHGLSVEWLKRVL